MIAWIVKKSRVPAVVGVFSSADGAEQHLSALDPEVQALSFTSSREDLEFPCLAIEEAQTFSFVSQSEAVTKLSARGASDESAKDVTVYAFPEPFVPIVPGRDEMGRIPHWHVGAADAERIRRDGLAALWRERPWNWP